MAGFMHDLEVKKISFVTRAANKRKFLLFKSAEKEKQQMPKTFEEVLAAKGIEGDELSNVLELAKQHFSVPPPDDTGELRQLIEKAEQRAEKLEKQLDEERNKRIDTEFTVEAKKYQFIPLETSELASILRKASESFGDAYYNKFVGLIKSTNDKYAEAVEEKGSIGKSTSAGTSAYSILEERAKKLVKEDKAKTLDEAMLKVADEDPALYRRYQAETQGRAN